MPITFLPTERPFKEDKFRRRLTDEYKLLQDKIDKIGGFRFTIKGWSVTAVIAASAAGSAATRSLGSPDTQCWAFFHALFLLSV